jgi:hypothetical protein
MATAILTSLNANIRPCVFNFNDWAFFCDGDNVGRYFDSNQGFNWHWNAPTTAITANESASGSMSGIYKYFYTEFNKTSGEGTLFYGHESPPSAIFTTGTLSSKKVTLTLPTTAVNTGCTHLKIYRTDAGGTTYYYIGYVAIGTATKEDNNITGDVNFPFGDLTEDNNGVITQDLLWFTQIGNPKFAIHTKDRILTLGCRPKTDGTISVTNGSANVTGTGTKWTTALEGSIMYVNGESRGFVVLTVSSATAIILAETYTGTTNASRTYEILGDVGIMRWSAKDPLTAKPQWWAFPTDYYRRINLKNSDETGFGRITDQPIVFGKFNHIAFTENQNDFVPAETTPEVGTLSHWTIQNDPNSGDLFFLNSFGKLFKTNGLQATDLNVDLTETVDGINLTYVEKCQAVFNQTYNWYMMIYPAEGSTACDRMLIYDISSLQWVIWKIRANCIHMIAESEDGQEVYKPWIGTVGGFVYKLCTGNNLGSTSGTLNGATTGLGTATLTDSSASFFTTGDGLKDVYLSRFTAAGEFIEEQKILSNTGTIITVDTNWTNAYQSGETYEVGSIRWEWKSKVFDFGVDGSKTIRKLMINFKKVVSSRKVRIYFYVSEDTEMPATSNQYIEFDLSYDYNTPLSLYDNRARYFQYKISGHGSNDPVTINNLIMDIMPNAR